MKLWLLTLDDNDTVWNFWIDTYAHPPSIDEIKKSLSESDYSFLKDEDIHGLLDSGKIKSWYKVGYEELRLNLEELDRHL